MRKRKWIYLKYQAACRHCNGTRSYRAQNVDWHTSCPFCGGTGRQKRSSPGVSNGEGRSAGRSAVMALAALAMHSGGFARGSFTPGDPGLLDRLFPKGKTK